MGVGSARISGKGGRCRGMAFDNRVSLGAEDFKRGGDGGGCLLPNDLWLLSCYISFYPTNGMMGYFCRPLAIPKPKNFKYDII